MKYFIYISIGLGFVEQVSQTKDIGPLEYFADVIAWPVFVGEILAHERAERFYIDEQ